MSQGQNVWLKNELLQANLNKQMIFWASSVSFAGNDIDNWGGFALEREEIANYLRDNNIKNMMIMCGDAHMIAIDDGSSNSFTTVTPNPNQYPIVQAAALNGTGSNKGGTYSEGFFINPTNTHGQFALVKVVDNGGTDICIEIEGRRTDAVGNTSTIVTYNFCRNIGLPTLLPLEITLNRFHQAGNIVLGGFYSGFVIQRFQGLGGDRADACGNAFLRPRQTECEEMFGGGG